MGLIIKNGIRYFGDNSVELTQAQYDDLSQAEKLNGTTYYITDGQNITTASAVTYDNTASGLSATNVQGAIDKLSDLGVIVSATTTSSNPITCANNTYTECVHLTLDKGIYLFVGMLGFTANATGVRGINISEVSGDAGIAQARLTANACESGQTRIQTVHVTTVTSDSTIYYLNAYQNSGSNLDVIFSRLLAVKIGM